MKKRLLLPLIFLSALVLPNGILQGAANFTPENIAAECERLEKDKLQPYLGSIIEHINKKDFESTFKRAKLCKEILEQLVLSKKPQGDIAFRSLYRLMQEKVNFVGKEFERKTLFEDIWPKLSDHEELQKYIFITTFNNLENGWNKDSLMTNWLKKLPKDARSDIFYTYFEQKEFDKEATLKEHWPDLSPEVADRCFSQLLAANKSNFMQTRLLKSFWDNLSENRRFTLVSKLYIKGTESTMVKTAALPGFLPDCPSLTKLAEITENQPIETEKNNRPSEPTKSTTVIKPATTNIFTRYVTRALCTLASVASGFFMGSLLDSLNHTKFFKKYPTCTILGCGAVGLTCFFAGQSFAGRSFAGRYGAQRFTQNKSSGGITKNGYTQNQKELKLPCFVKI